MRRRTEIYLGRDVMATVSGGTIALRDVRTGAILRLDYEGADILMEAVDSAIARAKKKKGKK